MIFIQIYKYNLTIWVFAYSPRKKKYWKILGVNQIYSKGSALTSIMPTINYFKWKLWRDLVVCIDFWQKLLKRPVLKKQLENTTSTALSWGDHPSIGDDRVVGAAVLQQGAGMSLHISVSQMLLF